jgi:hypothetical protein
MPVYQRYSPKGLLTKAAKANIAIENHKEQASSVGLCHAFSRRIP